MPSTPPEAAPSRDVTVASGECRQNAIKSRKENDWFGDASSSTGSSSRPSTAASGRRSAENDHRPRTANKTRESEQWFRYDANGTGTGTPKATSCNAEVSSSPTSGSEVTSPLSATKSRVQHGTHQDWYKHGDDVPDPPSLDSRSKFRSRRSACAESRHQTTDPNEWFRHDHARGRDGRIPEGATRPAKKPPTKVASPTSLWVVYPEHGGAAAELASTPRRLTVPEADDYYRRDKVGSSAEWFSHDHPRDDPAASTSGPTRMRGTPEGGEIASRLKGESEDWFSHDGNRNYVSPLPVGKGHSPLAKELMDRAQGSEIKMVFQMEESLRATWNAPPPLLGPDSPSSTSEVEKIRETMDNLLSNGQKKNDSTTAH